MELVRIRNLMYRYPDGSIVNLTGPDFTVHPAEKVVLLGANGSGKTTLLSHIMGFLQPSAGEVKVFGLQPAKHFNQIRSKLGVVLQRVEEQLLGPTVFDDVAFSLYNEGLSQEEIEVKVDKMLTGLRIKHLADKVPHYLSGGEKKKVALAGAMILNPHLLLLDEPFDGLDPYSRVELLQLLADLNREHGTAMVTATHDVELAAKLADVVYVIGSQGILLAGKPQVVFTQPEVLKEAKLEAPLATELFLQLALPGCPPLTLEEAVDKLKPLLIPLVDTVTTA